MANMYPNMDKHMPVDPQQPPVGQGYDPPPPYHVQQASAPLMGSPPIPPPPQQQQPVTILVDNGKFGPFPKAMKCYHCGQQVMTVTSQKAGTITWALCSLLCIVG
ncbi:unnamed protein product, partial [Medioppia subpectinata]